MPYRHDRDALRSRRDELQRDLEDIRRRAAALEALVESRAAIERELTDVEARLARAEPRFSLDDVRIASPCDESWERMTGDERVRFCDRCQKHVYNLSAMTRDEAERLIEEKDGSMCARLYQRADGTVITTDCPVGAQKKRVRRLAIAVTGAGALAAMAGVSMLTTMQGAMERPRKAAQLPEPEPVELTPEPDPVPEKPVRTTAGVIRVGRMRMPDPEPAKPAK
jgi:hypothetical protein